MDIQQLSGPTEESLRVERRGESVWKFFRTVPNRERWQHPDDWLRQLDRRVEIMREFREIAGIRLNTVDEWRRDELVLVTPFVEGPHPTVEEAKVVRSAIGNTPLGFLGDLTRWNMICSAEGLVLIDFDLYDHGYARFRSMTQNSPY